MKKGIPIYDICNIDKDVNPNLLVERLSSYLSKHYSSLHRPHKHSFYHLVLFTSGKGSHTIDFDSFEVTPFQMYFMIPGQVHSWHFEENVQGYIVHFGEELFAPFLQKQDYVQQFSFFNGNSKDGVVTLLPDTREPVANLFEQLIAEVKQQSDSLDLVRVLLLQLFLLVERCCSPNIRQDMPQQNMVLIKHFKQLVDKHFRTMKLPKEYARLLYITPNHLNAVSQDALGVTAGDIIRDRIILEAKRLLTNADMDVTQIAYDLNFQDNSYFNRFFKKYVGVTPDQFRRTIVK